MRLVPRSLVGRITLVSALASALAGAGAALSAGLTARKLGANHETAQLRQAAFELADELREELFEPDDDADDDEGHDPESALAHELKDVKLEGARAGLWLDGKRVAGDPLLPALAANECAKIKLRGQSTRVCSVSMGSVSMGSTGLVTLASTMRAEQTRGLLLLRALAVGILGGALLGAALSYFFARWAVAPLNALRDGVRKVRAEDPSSEPIGQALDQPELEDLRVAIATLVERLTFALSQAQAFAAEAAHELRTPLTTLAGELELMAESGAQATTAELLRVHAQVTNLTALVQRLLVLAQPAPLDLQRAELLDLDDVLGAVMQAQTPTQGARIRASCANDVLVRGDGALLRSLLSNAIENALKFSSGPVEVHIAGDAEDACIDVLDTGPGVPPSERERVFAPFYRSPATRASGAQGHGLGLSLIARVAFRHHGSAQFLDRARGAQLRVRLPRVPVRTS